MDFAALDMSGYTEAMYTVESNDNDTIEPLIFADVCDYSIDLVIKLNVIKIKKQYLVLVTATCRKKIQVGKIDILKQK